MKIKNIFVALALLLSLLPIIGQAQGVALAPAHAVCDYEVSGKVDTQLKNKMVTAITTIGMSSMSELARFALVPTIAISNERTMASIPVRTEMDLDVTFAIVDLATGDIFDSYRLPIACKGSNKANTIAKGIASINLNTSDFNFFLRNAQARIVDYYENNLDNIITSAKNLAKQGEYDHALYLLSGIPSSIPSYKKVNVALEACYQDYINYEGARLLGEAQAIWSTNPTSSGAIEAGRRIAIMPVGSKYNKEAKVLLSKIEQKLKLDDDREWALLKKELEHRYHENITATKAARDVAIAYAKNQPKNNFYLIW